MMTYVTDLVRHKSWRIIHLRVEVEDVFGGNRLQDCLLSNLWTEKIDGCEEETFKKLVKIEDVSMNT
jgi:hypothetical protein